ncbi:uncharacterized protein VDAG_04942 [Verticillium dahliae VdLs.17]|uniref:Uncharacterized protein n=1 Tax=Verticillium dahliae (strain VdLs.17 / ATCC MYA-4575 / FGSC 10137) TaxID=498257 RepID=G2X3F7_VERDV|nr:uncharacterized protein VDAG_04942 [Verticillium dahliae VdLs.17]EGY23504.1 hypothetical protein VDAG_04942 [Verticillium dahliae VdLs.17]
MATLGRSLKSPVYLSRASSSSNGSRRPALAARTFSHSSDISAASANSWADDHLDVGVMSGLNTPALEKTVTESLAAKESRPAQKEVKGRHSQGKSDIFLASLSLCVCARASPSSSSVLWWCQYPTAKSHQPVVRYRMALYVWGKA